MSDGGAGQSRANHGARLVGVDAKTAASYVDLLVDLLLVRRLPSWHANVGKRIVKSPKVYVRDSGLVHALLGLDDKETLLSHPVGREVQAVPLRDLARNLGGPGA